MAVLFICSTAFFLHAGAHKDGAETYPYDVVSLLQISAKRNPDPMSSQRVFNSPTSGAMKFVGRHDVIRHDNQEIVRFDAAGFEMHFQVTGATEVKLAIAQEISGPDGWFFAPHKEEKFADGCLVFPPEMKPSLFEEANAGRSSVTMEPSGSQPQHFLVYVNGVPQTKPLQKNSQCHICTFDTSEARPGQVSEYTVARGLSQWESHHIRIVKTSEPNWATYPLAPNWLSLHSLILDQGSAHSDDIQRGNRRVEFLGDSWMSGYCNECKGGLCNDGILKGSYMEGEKSDSMRWGSYALAWPHLVCEDLNANCHSTVLSGVGLHCASHPALDPNDCSEDTTLPMFWQRTLASDESSKWDFNAWTPDVLVMLGSSNEHFNDPARDSEAVLATYDKFLDSVYERHPNVHVLLVCLDSETAKHFCERLKRIVNTKKDTGVHVDLLDVFHIPEMENQKQCCGHPDEDSHKVIKHYVAEEVRRITGWV